ncbi:MAG: type III-A CRISPR-associated RAMP protein Csm4 [Candidatus Omnitrophica bacterium]|nr:type III-A CRISPR-associated RAMP protein Csm4 [Candidatus Omnitrophota bacterium]
MKYKLYKYKLKFLSSIHLGTREGFREETEEIIHSDTLFSAFCNVFYLLYGRQALDNLIQKFVSGEPPFFISSTFPFYKEVLYFPVPLNQIVLDKTLKKIKYVEKAKFEKILAGETLENVIDLDEEHNPLSITTQTPRLSINRINNSPGENFFFFSDLFYTSDSGLFFLVDFKDNAFIKQFDATLRLLSHEGIGGDRTCGKGHFSFSSSFVEFNLPDNSNAVVALSLYLPKEDEFGKLKQSYCEIIERKGYIFSPFAKNYRKKSVRMITEGSVIPGSVQGMVVDTTPEIFTQHKIYRYGLCFSLPCINRAKK